MLMVSIDTFVQFHSTHDSVVIVPRFCTGTDAKLVVRKGAPHGIARRTRTRSTRSCSDSSSPRHVGLLD